VRSGIAFASMDDPALFLGFVVGDGDDVDA
jgi:hypothetical protein